MLAKLNQTNPTNKAPTTKKQILHMCTKFSPTLQTSICLRNTVRVTNKYYYTINSDDNEEMMTTTTTNTT